MPVTAWPFPASPSHPEFTISPRNLFHPGLAPNPSMLSALTKRSRHGPSRLSRPHGLFQPTRPHGFPARTTRHRFPARMASSSQPARTAFPPARLFSYNSLHSLHIEKLVQRYDGNEHFPGCSVRNFSLISLLSLQFNVHFPQIAA